MATYLLAWNPKIWQWDDLPDRVREIEEKESTVRRWSCGNSTQIRRGDCLFLIRLGEEPKGILASGNAVSDWYEDLHWDETKAWEGVKTHYVKVRFDALLDPSKEPILPRKFLNHPPFSDSTGTHSLRG